MNFRQPDPGGSFLGGARSVIRIVSDTESGKLRPPDESPRRSMPSSDIFGSFQGLGTTAMLTRFAIPRLRSRKTFKCLTSALGLAIQRNWLNRLRFFGSVGRHHTCEALRQTPSGQATHRQEYYSVTVEIQPDRVEPAVPVKVQVGLAVPDPRCAVVARQAVVHAYSDARPPLRVPARSPPGQQLGGCLLGAQRPAL